MSTETVPVNSDVWPYTPRDSEYAADHVAGLYDASNLKLSDKELEKHRQFSEGLQSGVYGGTETDLPPLETIIKKDVAGSIKVYHDGYLDTLEGQKDLAEMGFEAITGEDAFLQLCEQVANGKDIAAKARRTTSVNSMNWFNQQYAEQLTKDPATDADFVDPNTFRVNFSPDTLLGHIEGLQGYKRFYRSVARQLREQEGDTEAERFVLGQYVARVNSQLAIDYPRATYLREQLEQSPRTELTDAWSNRLRAALPVLYTSQEDNRFDSLARRLDMIRNGAVVDPDTQDAGNFGVLSQKLREYAGSVEDGNLNSDNTGFAHFLRSRTDKWNGDQLKEFLTGVLRDWKLLSEYDTDWHEVADRTGPAQDGKWQAFVTPRIKSLTVTGNKKIVEVPSKFDRSFMQRSPKSGVAPVTAHELMHVLQHEADRVVAESVPLARIKGSRSDMIRELGGIVEESIVFAAAGIKRVPSMRYMRALQAKQRGANRAEVVRASHEAGGVKALSPEADLEARLTSVSTAGRLYRHGGHDSQALNYLEQGMVQPALAELPDNLRISYLSGGASFSLGDAVKLRHYGLLKFERNSQILSPSAAVLRLCMQMYQDYGDEKA